MAPPDQWSIEPIGAAGGAKVLGPDLSIALAEEQIGRLQDLLAEHLVLVLPGQKLDAERHVALAHHFGKPYVHPFLEAVPEHPAILQVLKTEADFDTFGGEYWHVDISFEQPPAAVSLLYSFEIPPLGGDTLFANQQLAWEQLSPGMQVMLDALTAPHVYPGKDETEPHAAATHPVVRVHPSNGRKALYVNPAFVDRFTDMSQRDSAALLNYLFAHQTRPEFQFRVGWQPNQLTIWDNRAVQHYAMNDYPGQRRRLQRVTAMERSPDL